MKEKFAVVTGSTKGIGKAIGCLLLRNGFHVIFNYASDTEAAGLLQEELQSGYQGRFDMIHQKLETQEDVETFCKECRKIATHFDVLVLNVSLHGPDGMEGDNMETVAESDGCEFECACRNHS